jgi:hypothetical protein
LSDAQGDGAAHLRDDKTEALRMELCNVPPSGGELVLTGC